jgi:deoxyribodipyrimidine photo-lyase
MKKQQVSIFWFRRDLRLDDNHGLSQALSMGYPVLPIFIFDTDIIHTLPRDDHRITYIHDELSHIHSTLREQAGSGMTTYHGVPRDIFKKIMHDVDVMGVYANHDYEPYAKKRDTELEKMLQEQGIPFQTFKDQVIFEQSEVVKNDGTPYTVYTPYMKKWRTLFNPDVHIPVYTYTFDNFLKITEPSFLELSDIGFVRSSLSAPHSCVTSDIIDHYAETRDIPALSGTSRISTALRFGTVSIRTLVKKAIQSENDTYLKELIWREFFMQILWHFPSTKDHAFKPAYDAIPWRNNPDEFEKWKQGTTGYPLVDAGMRELNQTGYMHNRVRMLTASFLCKHLLIDWRWGEQYFAEKLFDYEMSSNVGNWQWAAGSGVDAAPYFRVFNPEIQFKKFDPQGDYVRRWVPEYVGIGYVEPMVDHAMARERALEMYQTALKGYTEH